MRRTQSSGRSAASGSRTLSSTLLDDRRVIVGGASNVSAEQLQRSRAADRQSRGWRVELCEIFREHRKGRSDDPLVEAYETLDVSSDDAGGNEVRSVLLKLTL